MGDGCDKGGEGAGADGEVEGHVGADVGEGPGYVEEVWDAVVWVVSEGLARWEWGGLQEEEFFAEEEFACFLEFFPCGNSDRRPNFGAIRPLHLIR